MCEFFLVASLQALRNAYSGVRDRIGRSNMNHTSGKAGSPFFRLFRLGLGPHKTQWLIAMTEADMLTAGSPFMKTMDR